GPRIGNSAILQAIGQLLHQRALLSRQVRRREDFQLVEQVAGRLPAARRQSAPAQSHHASRLAAGRNLERHASVNGGRGDFGAERRFVVPHRQTHPQITARNREHGVKFDSNREKQIAILIGTRRAPALPLQAQLRSIGDSRGDCDFERAPRRHHTVAAAGRTCLGGANHARLALLFFARNHPAAAAGRAFVLGDEIEPPLRALDRIDERYFDLGAKVWRARGFGIELEAGKPARRAAAAASATASRAPAAAEKLREEIAEVAAAEVRAPAASRAGRGLLPSVAAHHLFLRHAMLPVGAKLVVLLALVGVTDDLVGLIQFLEFSLGFLVVGIDVGMELAGELAIGALDLRVARLAINSENFVVVAKVHQGYSVQDLPVLSCYSQSISQSDIGPLLRYSL